jgi:hypothetical protein
MSEYALFGQGPLGATGAGPAMVPCGIYALTLEVRGDSFAALPSTVQLQGPISAPDSNGFQSVTVINVSSQPFVIPLGFQQYTIVQYEPQGVSSTGPCASGTALPPPAQLPSCPAGQVWGGSSCIVATGNPAPSGSNVTSPWVYVGAAAGVAALIGGIWYYSRHRHGAVRSVRRARLTGEPR